MTTTEIRNMKAAAHLLQRAEKMAVAVYGIAGLLENIPEGFDEVQIHGIAAALDAVHNDFIAEVNANGEAFYGVIAMAGQL